MDQEEPFPITKDNFHPIEEERIIKRQKTNASSFRSLNTSLLKSGTKKPFQKLQSEMTTSAYFPNMMDVNKFNSDRLLV